MRITQIHNNIKKFNKNKNKHKINKKISKNKPISPKSLINRYFSLKKLIYSLNPKIIKCFPIGKSYLGQEILCIQIKANNAKWKKVLNFLKKEYKDILAKYLKQPFQNKKTEKNSVKMLMHGAIHAREGMSGAVLIRVVEEVIYAIKAYEKATKEAIEYFIYNKIIYKRLKAKTVKYKACKAKSTELYLIPVVDPDGALLCTNRRQMWKKYKDNKRFLNFCLLYEKYINSVNINEKFNYLSFSGPFNRHLKNIFIKNKKFNLFKANLCFVDLNVNFPEKWGKGKSNAFTESAGSFIGRFPLSQSESLSLVNITAKVSPDVTFSLHCLGNLIYYAYDGLDPDPTLTKLVSSVLGHDAYTSEGSYGGYKEWFISVFNKPSYTIELGKEPDPAALDCKVYLNLFKETESHAQKIISLIFTLLNYPF